MAQGTISAAADGPISTLVYRSRAVRPLPEGALFGLVAGAQARNRSERLTGLVVYDDAAFFQWLEGPAENLARVMASIGQDGRHTDIEIIGKRTAGERVFPQCDMRLGLRGRRRASWPADVLPTPSRVVRGLRGDPREVLASLRSLAADASSPSSAGRAETAKALRAAVEARVFPELVRRHAPSANEVIEHPRASELARLLLGERTEAAAALLGEAAMTAAPDARRSMIHLLEGAARQLGDFWDEDACTGFDVDLGLCRMPSLSRGSGVGVLQPPASGLPPEVLVAPAPREEHLFGAALVSDELRRSGWTPRCGYPATDAELMDLLAAAPFDAVVLWLSPALRREHRLGALAATVAAARRASRNPRLLVLVGGRAFARPAGDAGVRADLHLTTAAGIDWMIRSALRSGGSTREAHPKAPSHRPDTGPGQATASPAPSRVSPSSLSERPVASPAGAPVLDQTVPALPR